VISLIVHGWLYVVYLYANFRLWILLRWGIGKFLLIAAGGVVPFLSFFTERYYRKVAEGWSERNDLA
jgi:integral membrane protein